MDRFSPLLKYSIYAYSVVDICTLSVAHPMVKLIVKYHDNSDTFHRVLEQGRMDIVEHLSNHVTRYSLLHVARGAGSVDMYRHVIQLSTQSSANISSAVTRDLVDLVIARGHSDVDGAAGVICGVIKHPKINIDIYNIYRYMLIHERHDIMRIVHPRVNDINKTKVYDAIIDVYSVNCVIPLKRIARSINMTVKALNMNLIARLFTDTFTLDATRYWVEKRRILQCCTKDELNNLIRDRTEVPQSEEEVAKYLADEIAKLK